MSASQADMWPTKSEPQRLAAPGRNVEMFHPLTADLYLAHHLFRRGRSSQILAGVTGFTERRERIRREILDARMAAEFLCTERTMLSTETFAQAFARLFGEPL